MAEEITIQVGFGDKFHDLTVRLQDGDIPPWQPGQKLDVVGQRKPRLDAVAKVTGTAKYAYDQRPVGLIQGMILRSRHGNADIRSVDVTKARAMPGVRQKRRCAPSGSITMSRSSASPSTMPWPRGRPRSVVEISKTSSVSALDRGVGQRQPRLDGARGNQEPHALGRAGRQAGERQPGDTRRIGHRQTASA